MTYLFKSQEDLYKTFLTDPIAYSVPGGTPENREDQFGDAFPVRQVQHGISASAGVVKSW
ncbi:MAG: hypothetical protein HY897_18350 [Deltaproteobacteria bacterium]|nr:hypothetical protein [Deltaproteobacteria bacterium]